MAAPVAFRLTEAVFETDRMTIEHHLQQTASEHDITVATDAWRGSWTSLGATISYQWQIEPANGRYQVVERLFISKFLLGLLVLPFVALAASFLWFTPYLTSPLYLAVILPTLIGAMLLGYGAVIIVVKAPSIIDQTRSINTNRTTQWPAVPLLIGLFAFLVIGFSSILVERWLVTVGVAVGTVIMGGAAVLWFDTVVSLVPSQIPTTVMTDTYLGLVLTAGATLSFVLVTIPAYVVPAANPVMTGLYLVTFLFTAWGIHWIITQSGQQVEYHDFKAGDRPATSRLGKITSIMLVAVASYGLAALLIIYVSTYSNALTAPTTDPLLTIVVLGAAIPALYIGSGLIYQTMTYGYRTLTLFTASRPVEPAVPLDIEATIRAVDTDTYYAGSLDTGFNQYIFVSEPILNDLNSEQQTAIIAHETGHLRNGDAFLSFIVPIAALLLLCGKNVLYSIIDFRSREYRADSYAIQHVDPTTFTETLSQLSAETMPQRTGATPAFSPFTGYQPQDLLGSVYGLFFGSFALAEAHPSVEDRIERCQSVE